MTVKEQGSHRLQNLYMHIKTCVNRTCYVPTVPAVLNFCLLYVAHPFVLLGLTMSPIMLCSIVVSFSNFFSAKSFGMSIYICNDWISYEACESTQ